MLKSHSNVLIKAIRPIDTRPIWQVADLRYGMDRTRPPGEKWTVASCPWSKKILDAWQSNSIQQVVEKAGSQTWKTTIMQMALAWSMKHRPLPKLWITANDDLAQKASNRIHPILERCPDLDSLLLPGRRNKNTYEIHTLLGYLYISGVESSTALEQEPFDQIFGDECRNWPAGSLQKLKMRQRNYRDAKRALFSTPDLAGDELDLEFNMGSQDEWLFPCQGCGDLIGLVWSSQFSRLPDELRAKSQMMFPKGTTEVWLECHCNHRHLDIPTTRRWILDHGQWQSLNTSTNPEERDPTIASFHWPAMLNPNVVWADLVKLFRKATLLYQENGILDDLKLFCNESIGESWEEGQQHSKTDAAAGTYDPVIVVNEPWDCITLGVDVQLGHFWHCAVGFRAGLARLLSYGKLLTWGEICAKEDELKIANPHWVFVDTTWSEKEVHSQCAERDWAAIRSTNRRYFPHPQKKGPPINRLYSEPRPIDLGIGTKESGRRHCTEFLMASPSTEDLLQRYLDGKTGNFEIPQDVTPIFQKQMHARLRVPEYNKRTGKETWIWKDIGFRERGPHMRECLKLCLLAASMAGVICTEFTGDPTDET